MIVYLLILSAKIYNNSETTKKTKKDSMGRVQNEFIRYADRENLGKVPQTVIIFFNYTLSYISTRIKFLKFFDKRPKALQLQLLQLEKRGYNTLSKIL